MTEMRFGRRSVLVSAMAAAGAAWAGPLFAQPKIEKPKVILAVGGKSALYYLSLTIAEKKGFFSKIFGG